MTVTHGVSDTTYILVWTVCCQKCVHICVYVCVYTHKCVFIYAYMCIMYVSFETLNCILKSMHLIYFKMHMLCPNEDKQHIN